AYAGIHAAADGEVIGAVEWVVRGGITSTTRLIAGYGEHGGVPGLFGFSVQYAPGKTVEELAQAGQLRNGQVSYALDDDLAQSLKLLGYTMRLVKSPGHGFHHTFAVLYDASGAMLHVLPADAANALSQTFQQRKNPYRLP
ncbi:MAG: hypothetical protein ACRDHP_09270, partial [Ktedonobacterales bacterium]